MRKKDIKHCIDLEKLMQLKNITNISLFKGISLNTKSTQKKTPQIIEAFLIHSILINDDHRVCDLYWNSL